MQLALRLKGGGSMPSEPGIAAGGLIKQDIRKDTRDTKGWAHGLIPFSVQILDTSTFRRVTGVEPPACPIDAKAVSPPQKSTTSQCTLERSCVLSPPVSLKSLGVFELE